MSSTTPATPGTPKSATFADRLAKVNRVDTIPPVGAFTLATLLLAAEPGRASTGVRMETASKRDENVSFMGKFTDLFHRSDISNYVGNASDTNYFGIRCYTFF